MMTLLCVEPPTDLQPGKDPSGYCKGCQPLGQDGRMNDRHKTGYPCRRSAGRTTYGFFIIITTAGSLDHTVRSALTGHAGARHHITVVIGHAASRPITLLRPFHNAVATLLHNNSLTIR